MSNPKTILRKEREKSRKFAKLERKMDEIIQELHKRKQLASQGRYSYNRIRDIDNLIRDFIVACKEVNAIVKESRR